MRVLDLGGYDGTVGHAVASAATMVIVLDLDQVGLAVAQKNGLGVVCGSAAAIPFGSNTFDVVLSFDMLNALPPELEKQVMHEIRRVLDEHALLILTVT